jgi:hypothetical protein
MKVKKGKKVDWAQIIYNNLCSELNRWYKYVENKGDKKNTCKFALILVKKNRIYLFTKKINHINH